MTPLRLDPIHVLDRASDVLWHNLASLRLLAAILPLAAAVMTAGGRWPQLAPALGSGWMPLLGLALPWSAEPDGGLIWADLARLVLALAGAVCLAHLAATLRPTWQVPGARRLVAADVALPGSLAGAQTSVERALGWSGRSVVCRRASDTGLWMLADRPGARRWLPGLVFAGTLALLGAFAVASVWGWEGEPAPLLLGETHSVGEGTGLDVRLEQVVVYPGADGAIERLQSRVAIYLVGEAAGSFTLEEGKSRIWQGVGFYQLGHVPSARVSATDSEGRALGWQRFPTEATLEPVLRVGFSDERQEQILFVPESDLVVHLVDYPSLPSMGLSGRVLHVQISRASDGAQLGERFLAESGFVEVGGTRIDVALEYGATLLARHDPQRPLVWLGSALLVLGLLAAALWPQRPVWIALREEDGCVLCRIAAPRGRGGSDLTGLRAFLDEGASQP
ncbi:MAG: cytochrome c biogenesis protein ResB [Anaerolineae bacterium]